ncbi:putative oxidoreductase [Actinoplanes missouriensis 431]|uniref:Putative oxidoreductase n=1 Tax=Actinoplanes missouriensis (strain ATCC 14538 / DSM 43046 / CBS 188.64 / JCM 3121 / NBRC 102363 / NCIMB 12654 / NRRL B-3342 / UNCC 431) TaxID=512565 RepID=I0HCM5_ACTM4|nr:ferredoxin reductase family protein [Actinoplanes missouriensis]BAL90762.1 putative oxidoreductase [Actinoplanes missouriensis 431]
MIAVTHPQVIAVRRSARVAHVALWAFLLVNLAVVQAMYVLAGPAHNLAGSIGRLLGLYLAFVMALQLLLVARLPILDRGIGMDRLTTWHRWTGFAVLWLVLLHPAFVVLGFAQQDRASYARTFLSLAGQLPVLLGVLATCLIVLVVALSVRAARRRLSYETWHAVHLLLYAVVVLGVIHQVYEGTAFKINIWTQVYWWGLWTFALGALLAGRLIVPLARNARHRMRVAAVVPESGDVVSVHVTGRHLERLQAAAGQFFLWRFPEHQSWWQVNPFSLSAAPNGRSLRLTAKAIGTTSAGLRDLPIGTRVYAEGPYGAFTLAQRSRSGVLLIAGGIGVTPIRALLEDPAIGSDVVVLYRVRSTADAVLLGELRNLARVRGARLHVLTGRTGGGNQPFQPENLATLVPDVTDRDTYVCGPAPLTRAVVASLRSLRVPSRQIHAELFRLAA